MSDTLLPILVLVPFAMGLVAFVLPGRGRFLEVAASLTAAATFVLALLCFIDRDMSWAYTPVTGELAQWIQITFVADPLGSLVVLAASLFGLAVVVHSWRAMESHPRRRAYYAYVLWTLGATAGALLADGVVLFLFFWGLLAILLYLLVGIDGAKAQPAARKSFLIVGGADFITVLGVALLVQLAGKTTFSAMAEAPLAATGLGAVAFGCVLVGALAKAGAMPLHSWIPSAATASPADVMAFLPASLDKLLGIYLLARLSVYVFDMSFGYGLALMIIGAVTIVVAGSMSIVQKDLRKLLAWCAISQVGYIVLGLGTGSPIGVAGALFHMLNHATYKSCLFLCCGNVESATRTTTLDKLGGLSRVMPATFGAFLVAALAVSGIPPLNGFVSKWMIFQSTVEASNWSSYQGSIANAAAVPNPSWWVFLVAAMFGSALTLAAFMKALYSVFLGEKPKSLQVERPPISMRVPVVVLASLCILFGVLAVVPVDWIKAALPQGETLVAGVGLFTPGLATGLLILSLLAGAFVYWLANKSWQEEDDVFLGGESIDEDETRVPGSQFYRPFAATGIFRFLLKSQERGAFDPYVLLEKSGTVLVRLLRRTHTGVLTTYLFWIALGTILLLFGLMGG